tara:strand:- start:449 stop:1009 length:561 start_codon:yes stop_codon:yes gene_type:complete
MSTQKARQKMMRTAADRWSLDGGIEQLYSKGAGSLYTNGSAGNIPVAGSAPGLDKQIEIGVDFFGYGRGSNVAGRLGDQANNNDSERMNVAGVGRQQTIRQRGTPEFGRFKTKQSAMDQNNSQYGADGGAANASASWYTAGLDQVRKYGNTLSGNIDGGLGGREGSTRGRTDASSLNNGSGAQSKY